MVKAELPGVDPDHDIDVSIDNGVLTIAADASGKQPREARQGLSQ